MYHTLNSLLHNMADEKENAVTIAETVTLFPNNRKIEISTSAAVPGSFCPKTRSKMPLGALKTLRSVSGPGQRSCPLPSRSDAGLARYPCFQVLKNCLGR